MKIVVDSNLITALILNLPYSESAKEQYVSWLKNGDMLLAPTLLEYEVTSVLRRSVHAGILSEAESLTRLRIVSEIDLTLVAPTLSLKIAAIKWAGRLGQAKAYDSHFLALAEQEGAAFWSADKRLINGVRQLGIEWVYAISA